MGPFEPVRTREVEGIIGYVRQKANLQWVAYNDKKKRLKLVPTRGRPAPGGVSAIFIYEYQARDYVKEQYMATRRNPIRRRRRNSAVRMDQDFTINPAPTPQDELTITIKAPKGSGLAESLASDLSMIAMQDEIPNTRGNPRKRKAKKRKRSPRMKKVFGNPVAHLPKTRAKSGTHAFVGRPTHDKWYAADLYDSKEKKITSVYGRGGKKEAETEAQDFLDRRARGKTVKSVIFSGPYNRKPTARTIRK